MSSANTVSLADAIAHLRTLQPEQGKAFTAEQIRTIVDDVYHCVPLEVTMTRPELADVAVVDVLGIVEEFGKHRARVHKRGRTATVNADDTGMLIPYTRDEVKALAEAGVTTVGRGKRTTAVPTELVEHAAVIVPRGYEHGAYQTRDISASLAAMVTDQPSDAEIQRFRSRHFDRPTAVLTADHVHLLHWTVRNGLSHKLLELGPAEYSLGQLFVKSYELLDVARLDAAAGVRALATTDAQTADVAELRSAAAKASWLFPAEFARLDKVLAEVEKSPDSARMRSVLRTKLFNFCTWLRSNSVAGALVSVENMTEGHLKGILASAGLLEDKHEEKEMAAHLRERLTGLGLANDLDREIPAGLKAWRAGQLDAFLASHEARAAGDPDWAIAYGEVAAAVAASEVSVGV